MELAKLIKTKNLKANRRLGRGESSGKGKTAARGHKGQKARTGKKIRLGFEGGQLPLIKRLPFRRGVGNIPARENITIATEQLTTFDSGSVVDERSLREKGLIKKTDKPYSIKIVAKGDLSKALKVKVATTAKAKELIEKAKGTVEVKLAVKEEKTDNA